MRRLKFKKIEVLRVLIAALATVVVYHMVLKVFDNSYSQENYEYFNVTLHKETIAKYYERRKYWVTSNLGSVLFKNQQIETEQKNTTFIILVWKYWDWLKNRHTGNHIKGNPLDECSVKNCIFTSDDDKINSVDAVLVHIQNGIFPQVEKRNTSQRWVFLSDESPYHSFSMAKQVPSLSKLANVFNWSMTYRSDADVPVPYGRTIPLQKTSDQSRTSPSIPYWEYKQKNVLVTALISHCSIKKRMNYVRELQKHIDVDVYGKCSTSKKKLSCPGHFKADCPTINSYLFYLAFENSGCRQYFTEKIFYNAYAKGAIPIVMGPPVSDCEKLLPPNSYLHIDNYGSPQELAMDILTIGKDNEKLQTYHKWREDFDIVNEHGYFDTKSTHLCRLCEALNFNDNEPKVYDVDSLKLYLEPKLLCAKPYQ